MDSIRFTCWRRGRRWSGRSIGRAGWRRSEERDAMNAYPYLARAAELLQRHSLEAILVGNAAAAIQGAPVTTVDIDFLFPKTPANIRKLKAITRDLDAVLMR